MRWVNLQKTQVQVVLKFLIKLVFLVGKKNHSLNFGTKNLTVFLNKLSSK